VPPHPPPKVSVALSVFNGERYIAATIESVLAQTMRDFELIVLDDGSTDATLAIAEKFAALDSRIRIISRENRGLVASLNQLLAEARAPLIARIDADDLCRPNRLGLQLEFMNTHPDHGVVGSNVELIDGQGNPLLAPDVTLPCDHAAIIACIDKFSPLYHPAVMYRRQLAIKTGGYRNAYSSAEDYDLWLRVALSSKLANIPDKLVSYRVHSQQISHRHLVSQSRRAAIAWLAYRERTNNRPDPTEDLDVLPTDLDIDDIFGAGSRAYVDARIADHVVAVLPDMSRDEWRALIASQIDDQGRRNLWRAAIRLARSEGLIPALRVALALLTPAGTLKGTQLTS